MDYGGDRRGVSVVVGAVLLFGVLILALGLYQAQIVPTENGQIEYDHSQTVQAQLQDLRNAVLRTAATGSSQPVSVRLGTRYPVRAFAVNPAPATGRLATVDDPDGTRLTVRNATAVDPDTDDYWDGSSKRFQTKTIAYVPDYNVYRKAPQTIYGQTVLYNEFPGGNIVLTGQLVVRGDTVTLVAIRGNLSEAGIGAVSVDPEALSGPYRTIRVKNSAPGSNVTLVLPSDLPAAKWRESLVGDQHRVAEVRETPDGRVAIELESGAYSLRMALVGVGSGATDPGAHYATTVSAPSSVAENSEGELTVEVRDRFNNPVPGATVNVSLVNGPPATDTLVADGQRGQTLANLETGVDGRVTVAYNLSDFDGSNKDVTVRVSVSGTPPTAGTFDAETRTNLRIGLTAVNLDGSGLGGDGGGGGRGPPNIETFAVTADVDNTPR